MKKIYLAVCFSLFFTSIFAQDAPKPEKKDDKKSLVNRANDHLMIQLGYLHWAGTPDTISTAGLPRTFNAYFMFDFPFKTNAHLSIAAGAGVGTDNMYFSKMYVGIKDLTSTLVFKDLRDTNYFKKYKLESTWLEVPLEFRYSSLPYTPNKSVKAALGIKVGTLVSAHTKGKTLVTKSGATLLPYTEKIISKRFFNSTRFVATARVSYGVFGIFGSYQVNTLFKQGFAPDVRPFTIGLSISGL
jgi:hypothetical protein